MSVQVDKAGRRVERGAPEEQEITTRMGRGRRLGRYLLLELIRRGKRTELYRAERIGRDAPAATCAIKMVRAELDSSLDAARELSHEIQILSQLDHPNIVRMEDHGNVAGALYLALEYLDGRSVSKLLHTLSLASSWMPVDVAVHVASEVALALAHVHRSAVGTLAPMELVHRDLRPSHVMLLRSGGVKLIDFGASRGADSRAVRRRTHLDLQAGTISYLAPEQVLGQMVDRRADLFSLGVVLWEMLAQRRLFAQSTAEAIASAITEGPITPLSALRSDIPAALELVLQRALERDPQRRYQTAEEMAADLGRLTPGRELMTKGVSVLVEATIHTEESGLLDLAPPPPAQIAVPPPPPPPRRPPPLPPVRSRTATPAAEKTAVSWRPMRSVLDGLRADRSRLRLVQAAALAVLSFAAGALWQRERIEAVQARQQSRPSPGAQATGRTTVEPLTRAPAPPKRAPRRRTSRAR
jgi:serine/threonine protein kinase